MTIGKKAFILIGIIFIILIVVLGGLVLLKQPTPLEKYLESHNIVNCLVIGIDTIDQTSRSDTVIVISFNTNSEKFLATFIPRDTLVKTSGKNHKLNSIYSFGYSKGGTKSGIENLRKTVEQELSLEIPYYIQVDYRAFIKIIDILGGVKIDIENPMKYIDHASGLVIDLNPGLQVLDGKRSLEYVRFRADKKGDIGRIERQRQFLRALFKTVSRNKLILKSPQLVFIIYKKVITNFSIKEVRYMFKFQGAMKKENLEIIKLPGSPKYIKKISYYISSPEAWDKKFNEFKYKKSVSSKGDYITIELLNGSGINGAGKKIAVYLRSRKFDVLFIDNAKNQDYVETVIYDRIGKIQEAEKVGDLLGTDNVFTRRTSDSYVDITVILGKDIEKLLKELD